MKHTEIMIQNGYITAQKAADLVGRELSTMHRWANEDKIRHARSGRRLFIYVESLREYFADNPIMLKRLSDHTEPQAVEPTPQATCE